MNILVSTHAEVEFCNGSYYHNEMKACILRYKAIGNHLICLNIIKKVEYPKQDKLDTSDVEFVEVNKINSVKGLIYLQAQNAKTVESVVQCVDLCIVHLPSFTGEQVVKYAKKYGKPCIVILVACVWDALWNYNWKGKLLAPFRFFTIKHIMAHAQYAMYVTQYFLQNRYPCHGMTIGISDVILPAMSERILENRLLRINQNDNRTLILTTLAAVDVPYKGQEYVIRAIAKLRKEGCRFEYRLVGNGNPTYLQNVAEKLQISDQIKFYGVIQHDCITNILDETDIYIQPSKQEGLPRALVEAMSRACPALGSNIAGIPELLDQDCMFNKGDVESICQALRSFTTDKMKKQAKINFEKAKLYELPILEARRTKFFNIVISNII